MSAMVSRPCKAGRANKKRWTRQEARGSALGHPGFTGWGSLSQGCKERHGQTEVSSGRLVNVSTTVTLIPVMTLRAARLSLEVRDEEHVRSVRYYMYSL